MKETVRFVIYMILGFVMLMLGGYVMYASLFVDGDIIKLVIGMIIMILSTMFIFNVCLDYDGL